MDAEKRITSAGKLKERFGFFPSAKYPYNVTRCRRAGREDAAVDYCRYSVVYVQGRISDVYSTLYSDIASMSDEVYVMAFGHECRNYRNW